MCSTVLQCNAQRKWSGCSERQNIKQTARKSDLGNKKKNELNENPTVFIYLSISEYGSPCCGISNSVGCDWRLLAGAVQLHGKYIYIYVVCVFYLRDWDTVKEQNRRGIFFWTHVFRCLAINLIHSQFWFLSPPLPSSCELERKLLQRYVHFMFQFKALHYCSFAPRLQSICVWMSLCFWLSLLQINAEAHKELSRPKCFFWQQ